MSAADLLETVTDLLVQRRLINSCEQARVLAISETEFPFRLAMQHCQSVHLHIKVDDANEPELNNFLAQFCELEYGKEGFVKYNHDGYVNLIFSSIPVSEDELLETECQRRSRPFLDHIGIDLRDETAEIRRVFAGIRATANEHGWAVSSQGDGQRGVHCCHVEVQAKHWAFPHESSTSPQIPLEFAFGQLKVNEVSGGCDLRPMDPVRKLRDNVQLPACHD